LRKTFLVAAVATFAFGITGVAQAQDPSIDVSASVSPGKAGTKSKPKNTKFTLSVTNDPASRTTAGSIKITLPSTLKLSTKGLAQCTASDDKIVSTLGKVCEDSIAGASAKCKYIAGRKCNGSASAVLLNANGTTTPVLFDVIALVGKNEMLFVLHASIGNNYVTHGKISGKTMTITIGPALQQPLPGSPLFAALVDLKTSLTLKKGKNYLFSSSGCKSKKHTINVTVGYAPNPNQPPKPSASGSADAKCS